MRIEDLTLEKFVETLGVSKDDFLIDEIPTENKEEKPKVKKSNYHKNKRNYKKNNKQSFLTNHGKS